MRTAVVIERLERFSDLSRIPFSKRQEEEEKEEEEEEEGGEISEFDCP